MFSFRHSDGQMVMSSLSLSVLTCNWAISLCTRWYVRCTSYMLGVLGLPDHPCSSQRHPCSLFVLPRVHSQPIIYRVENPLNHRTQQDLWGNLVHLPLQCHSPGEHTVGQQFHFLPNRLVYFSLCGLLTLVIREFLHIGLSRAAQFL